MKLMTIIMTVLVAFLFLFGCSQTTPSQDNNAGLVGNDKDEHGCIPSAGYSWCEVKQKCLRIWEESCNTSPSDTNGNTNSEIANPASTNCIENGGDLTIVDTPNGQVGMCKLPSGKECEEWAYFKGECTE